jgi:DNA-binding transcriptional regulator YiaG
VNYGIPNDIPQPTIAPSTPIPLAERIRPAWLCITAPEHTNRGVSEKDTPDLTPEQIAEAEAEDLRRQTVRALKKQAIQDERERNKLRNKLADKAAREAISRARQDARKAKDHAPTIGESILAFRTLHHLSRDGLAKLIGCAPQSITNWEHDRNVPRKAIIEKIAELDKATGYQ